mgnify:CR=1 FL=1
MGFADEGEIPSWAYKGVAGLVKEEVISGYEDNTFKAQNSITRGEAITLISRVIKMEEEEKARGLASAPNGIIGFETALGATVTNLVIPGHITYQDMVRVMSYNPNPDSAQAKCGQLFSNMLSEIRAYGQGLVIVDQVPERLIPDAIKNTNLKIIHRLIASDDIDSIASSMGLTNDQRSIIPRLATGQAIVSGVNAGTASYMSDSDVYWCKIHCKK